MNSMDIVAPNLSPADKSGTNQPPIKIKKRNGTIEDLQLEKMHKVVFHACKDIAGVSESELEMKSHISFYDGITTEEIQETLIKSASELITEDTPNYQWVAGRLINYHIRKMVYGSHEPWHLKKIVEKNVGAGFYDPELLTGENSYTDDEWEQMNSFVRHKRDFSISYCGMEQFRGKYLVQNRVTKQIFETPQVAYVLIAACLFSGYPKEERMKWVRDYYNAVSTFQISLPTPVMAGVRTPQRQFSSCVLIECGDSIDSINATTSAIVKYVSQRAGIGIGASAIRSIGSKIRNGDAYHTGAIPYFKMFQSAVNSCSQGGVRKGSATLYFPIWTYEFEDLVVLKNNKGTDETRCRHMDYGVQISKLFYERLIKGGDISFFSPSEVPGLHEAFFADQDEFERLYVAAEKDESIRRKTLPATEVFSMIMNERKNTGRIYIMNVDNANRQSAYKPELAPVTQSNLCLEILNHNKPLENIDDPNGEIALCTLSAINWGRFSDPKEMQKPCELAVRALDALLDYQKYPVLAAEISTMGRRHLGIGIINLAYWMTKNDMTYSRPKLSLIDKWAEHWSYYIIEASNKLAIEKGACPKNNETKYSDGIVPCDTRSRHVDDLISHNERLDWDGLRASLKENGIRNSTLMALMPAETSAQISNSTNGIEPPKAPVSVKQSKDGVLKQVVPSIAKYKNKYEYLWDMKSPTGYLKIMAVLQKWIDQSGSYNTAYNPQHFKDEKVPMSVMLGDLLFAYKYGLPTLYYFTTHDNSGEIDVDKLNREVQDSGQGEESIVNEKPEDEICESCSI